MHRVRRLVGVGAVLAALAGCSSGPRGLDASGPEARRIETLTVLMTVIATVITVAILVWLVRGLTRRRRDVAPRWSEQRLVVAGGIVMPLVVVTAVSIVAVGVIQASERTEPEMRIEVEGHQYWWEVTYADGTETANEIHIPTGVPVELVLTSDDVNHSFWVPALGGKLDLIPGTTNEKVIEAAEPGTYEGLCAEYCGIQHANMRFLVVAQPREDFDAWLDEQARPADAPEDEEAARGQEVFEAQACAGCHTVRGTEAQGELGPDLTHVAARSTLAGLAIDNTEAGRRRWVDHPQVVKEGNEMPDVPLTEEELDAVLAYLDGLR